MKRLSLPLLLCLLTMAWTVRKLKKVPNQASNNFGAPMIDLKDSPAEELFTGTSTLKVPLTQKSAKKPEQIYEEADYVVKIEIRQFEKITFLNKMQSQSQSFGSGIVMACEKYRFCVLTARHVTDIFMPAFYAHFKDGTPSQKLELIGQAEEKYDTALLKFADPNFQPKKLAKLGQSAKLKPGAKILAIGSNILGDFWFSADGYLFKEVGPPTDTFKAALAKAGLPDYPKVMLIKNEIFHGYSGGPFLNEKGEVVGIITAYLALDAVIINLGVPIDEVKEAMEQILKQTP